MFAHITTNNATDIVIYIPFEKADKNMPALAEMLEQNSVFVQSGYNSMNIVKPKITFELGGALVLDGRNEEVLVIDTSSCAVVDDQWVSASPEVFSSNKKAIEKLESQLSAERRKNSMLTNELEIAKETIRELKGESE